jgi:predicted molibdopterin-dependent oxidoreductase YjgC
MDVLSDLVLKGKKGTDLELIEGFHAALYKLNYISAEAPFEVEKTISTAADATGIAEQDILDTADLLGQAKNPFFIYGKGITRNNDNGPLKALLSLANALNKGESKNIISVKGQANSVVASQYALDKHFELNGHKAAFIAIGDDEPSERLIEKVEKSPFTIVQSSYVSKLTALADVVFPVGNWLESEGHFMNLEGRLQKANKSLQAEENVKSNVEVLKLLAERIGVKLTENWEAELSNRTPISQTVN